MNWIVNGLLTWSICDFSLMMSYWQFNKKLSDHWKLFQLSLRMSAQHFTPLHPAVVGIFLWLADRCTDWHLLPLKLRRKLAWLKMNCQSRAPEAELSWLDHTFTVMQQDPSCLVNTFHTIGTQTFCKKKCVVSFFFLLEFRCNRATSRYTEGTGSIQLALQLQIQRLKVEI